MSAPTVRLSVVAQARVACKLTPAARGALKLAQRYGAALVCVRDRISADGRTRYTIVELRVDSSPIAVWEGRDVGVRIGPFERHLRAAVQAAGARWDPGSKLWRMPRRVATLLRWVGRIADR